MTQQRKTDQEQTAQGREAANSAGLKGLIFDVQGHSVHDGPGTRTTVFLNGCPLHCIWCCNPEGLFHKPVLLYRETKCVHCGNCIATCPRQALQVDERGRLMFDRQICDQCTSMDCVTTCYHEALTVSGRYYDLDELMGIFQRDRQYWGSRGGVTFSGGEPLMQREFILALLRKCKESRIHTCIETTACVPNDFFREVLPLVDWVFADIKHMDPEVHRELTGVDNRLILRNIREMGDESWQGFTVIRIPVIPGCNDSEDNIRATARFVLEAGLEVINILPFHRLGESKYRQVGRTYRFAEQEPPTDDVMQRVKQIIESEGVVCFVGHQTPF